jgi:drug/metabolite transporter (DMT)-like permease
VTDRSSVERRTPEPPARREHVPRAIMYMVAATAIFSLSIAASKWLVATYPVGEVLFFRALVSLVLFTAFVVPVKGLQVFRTGRPGAHLLRGVSQSVSQTLQLIALSLLSIASVTALNFSAPLFATLASLHFLKEPVGTRRWIALAAGFLGVLIITNPGTETFQIGALFALASAVLFGTVTAGVRGMTSTESAETLTLYQLILLACFYAVSLPFSFAAPTWADAPLFLLNGATAVFGQYWWTRALHLAPTSAVVPFQYLSLIWAMMIGFAVWGDLPTVSLIAGSAIVVGSGLFLLLHEARRKAAQT